MREHGYEIRDGLLELNFEGVVVGRLHTQRISRLLASNDLCSIGNSWHLQVPGVWRSCLGVNCTLESIYKVMCGDRFTIRPLGIFAQVEDVVLVILGFPGLRDTGNNLPFRTGCHETFKQVAQNCRLRRSFNFLWVQGRRLGTVAFYQLLDIRQLGSRRDIGSLSHIDATKQCSHQQCVNHCFFMSHFPTPTRTFHAFFKVTVIKPAPSIIPCQF